MKRFHVHMAVENLDQSIRFYSSLFAAEPAVVKPDYAKWMLDDPRVNFAISTRAGAVSGVDHLGIQVEDKGELADVYTRLRDAGGAILDQGATTCCYAKSEKNWIADPQGMSWEAFLTTGESTVYGDTTPKIETKDETKIESAQPMPSGQAACCGPAKAPAPAAKAKAACC